MQHPAFAPRNRAPPHLYRTEITPHYSTEPRARTTESNKTTPLLRATKRFVTLPMLYATARCDAMLSLNEYDFIFAAIAEIGNQVFLWNLLGMYLSEGSTLSEAFGNIP